MAFLSDLLRGVAQSSGALPQALELRYQRQQQQAQQAKQDALERLRLALQVGDPSGIAAAAPVAAPGINPEALTQYATIQQRLSTQKPTDNGIYDYRTQTYTPFPVAQKPPTPVERIGNKVRMSDNTVVELPQELATELDKVDQHNRLRHQQELADQTQFQMRVQDHQAALTSDANVLKRANDVYDQTVSALRKGEISPAQAKADARNALDPSIPEHQAMLSRIDVAADSYKLHVKLSDREQGELQGIRNAQRSMDRILGLMTKPEVEAHLGKFQGSYDNLIAELTGSENLSDDLAQFRTALIKAKQDMIKAASGLAVSDKERAIYDMMMGGTAMSGAALKSNLLALIEGGNVQTTSIYEIALGQQRPGEDVSDIIQSNLYTPTAGRSKPKADMEDSDGGAR